MQPNNKRIAKNAVMLTLRSILVAIIGLYTSRVVLETLGVDDYGIYGVIGGIVGVVAFLNTAMANATSRFITFELGSGNNEKLKNVFSTALYIHFFIAILVIIFGETIGLWFLNHKMVIPEDRIFAANVLYQFSVFSVMIGYTQVPYSASIIAHEKMSIYAYFEILFVVLKLAIVFALLVTEDNRLILYGALTFAVSIIRTILYRLYCIKKFPYTKTLTRLEKDTAKKMLSFSLYDLYGNVCVMARVQGQPIVLNLFYGVVANAAATIASTVSGTISSLTLTIMQAFMPQIIKQYAAGDVSKMSLIMKRSAQFTLLAYSAVAVPVFIETSRVLYIWLGQIPPYAVSFLRLIMLASIANVSIDINNAAIHATGNVKRYSFITGTIYLMCLLLAYLWFKLGGAAYTLYLINAILLSVVMILGWIFVKIQIPEINGLLQPLAVCKSLLVIVVTGCIAWFIDYQLFSSSSINSETIWQKLMVIIIITLISLFILSVLYPIFALGPKERTILWAKLSSIIKKITPVISNTNI